MTMRAAMLAVVLMFFVVGLDPAAADIYKYTDNQGVTRYTYDLAEVPEDQRPQVQTFEEASPTSDASPLVEEDSGNDQDKSGKEADEELVVDEKTIEELNQKKKALDEEFAGLMEEKYKLLKDKEKLKNSLDGRDTVAVAEYDNKVKELNRKIADYQKRRDAFEKKANAVKKAVENPDSK
jgi:chromosome segregation ATPase